MKLHPLINPNSPHYEAQGKSAIEILEETLTVKEMIGFCKGNIFKYEYRVEHKGQKDSDIEKIKTYKDYLDVLNEVYLKPQAVFTVKEAFDLYGYEFKYKD